MRKYLDLPGRRKTAAILALVVAAVANAATARAQQALPDSALPGPRLLTVVPPGARVGSSIEVTFTGTDIEEPETLLFSQRGIKAEPVIPPEPPPDPKKPKPPADAKKPPVVITKFKVTIPADAPLGLVDVRLVNKWGVSNARAFVIGDLPEVMEKEPNNDVNQAQRIVLNSTVNGSMAGATDVDYYVFNGTKGQRVVVSCLASTIDSRFHAAVEIYDAGDRLLAFNRNYDHRDALTDCVLPTDGDYFVRVFEYTHTQGSPEHFYRLSISTAPWVDTVYPCVVEPGKQSIVTVYGRNLPGGRLDPAASVDGHELEKMTLAVNAPADTGRLAYSGRLDPKAAGLSGFEVRVRNRVGSSNPFLLTLAKVPVVTDDGRNDTRDGPQPIAIPCEIAGMIEKRRDRDWYAFVAKKGDVIQIEALGDRVGSEAFIYFMLRNATTKQDLYESPPDYAEPQPPKFYARTEDPAPYRFVAPADGKYLLLVGSRLADALVGPRHYYRVRLTPEMPDFFLGVTPPADHRPDGATLLQGGHQSFTVFATRRDGFAGEIRLSVEGLPAGVTCAPQSIAAGGRQTQMVLTAAANATTTVAEIRVKGTAIIGGRQVEHEARPAGVVWPPPQNAQVQPLLTRLDRSLMLAVRPGAPYAVAPSLDKPAVLQGGKTDLKLKLTRLWPDAKAPLSIQATTADLVPGLTVNNNQPATIAADKNDGSVPVVVGAGVAPGKYNLVLRTSGNLPFNKDPAAKQKQPINVVQPSASVSLTVLPKTVANLALANAAPAAKAGSRVEVMVRVARLFEYGGDFKVQLVVPPAVKGISADDVTIPAGRDEAKLVLRVAADAPPGNLSNLIVRATAVLNGDLPVLQETKFGLNILKP
jgi:hypothetical protein